MLVAVQIGNGASFDGLLKCQVKDVMAMSAKISQNANGSDMAVIDIKISKTIVFGNVILQIIVFKVFTKHNYVTQCCIFQCFSCWGDQITRILNMMMSYGCVVFDVFQVCFLEMCYKVIIEY